MQIIKFYNGYLKNLWYMNTKQIGEYRTYENTATNTFQIIIRGAEGERQAYFETKEKMLSALNHIERMIQFKRTVIDITGYQQNEKDS